MTGIISQQPDNCDCALHHVEAFQEAIHRETARSLRSGKSFLLVLIDLARSGSGKKPVIMSEQIASILWSSTREIDAKGWYREGAVIAILFTEFGSMRESVDAAGAAIVNRLYGTLSGLIRDKDIRIAPHMLPESLATLESPAGRLG